MFIGESITKRTQIVGIGSPAMQQHDAVMHGDEGSLLRRLAHDCAAWT
jgi:hypothetical protein